MYREAGLYLNYYLAGRRSATLSADLKMGLKRRTKARLFIISKLIDWIYS